LACAHWAKFTAAVDEALTQPVREALPYPPILKALEELPHRKKELPNKREAIMEYMKSFDLSTADESESSPASFSGPVADPEDAEVAAAVPKAEVQEKNGAEAPVGNGMGCGGIFGWLSSSK